MSSEFKKIIDEEKPRERVLKYGIDKMNIEDRIAIILKTGTKNISVKELSISILSMINNLSELKDISVNKLTMIKGVGRVKALELIAAIELGKRVHNNNYKQKNKIKNSMDVYNHVKNMMLDLKKEHFYVLYLDNKKNIIELKLLFIGGINSCIIDIREIFKYAYLLNAASFICIHNHPSGEIVPSKNDNENTLNIFKVGNMQGIIMEDHLIIGDNQYYSYRENSSLIY